MLRILLFTLLLGSYLLIYVNHPTSLDDQAVIAESTSLAQHGRPEINSMAYGGYAPTSTWLPDTTVTDRLFFPIAPDASVVKIRIGWVDPTSGERLLVYDADGKRLAEDFALIEIDDV
jgi:hypothetical protein